QQLPAQRRTARNPVPRQAVRSLALPTVPLVAAVARGRSRFVNHAAPLLNPIRVLIVEDEIEAARLVTRRLSYYPGARFEVTHVHDLRSAFARIEQEEFDVMVLDLGLPDAEGFDTLASACGIARHLPIVLVTGRADAEVSVRA